MDGLLGYPRQPIVSRPPDAVPRLPSRLSQDSLHQLERRVKEPVAACKASRVRSWIQDLSISTHQNDLHELAQGTSQLTGRCGQIDSRGNAAVQGSLNLGRTAMGTAMPPPNPHIPVIDLTEPLNKRLKLSDHSHLSSQPLETKPQPLFNSTASRRVPTPQQLNRSIATSRPSQPSQSATTATIANDAPSNSVAAQHSAQKNLVIDLTDQKAKGLEKGDIFKTKLKDVFPDMCEDYIQTLYVKYDIQNRSRQSLLVAVQNTLDEILAKSSYPKKQTPKKRKQMDDTIDNNDLQRIRGDQVYYFAVACKLLQKHFTSVPQATVQKMLMQYKTFLKTYIALHYFGRPVSDASEYWRRLHNAKDKHPPLLAVVLEHELREAKRIISEKEDVDKKKAEEARERIIVEEHRRAGTLAECQCCFTEVLPDRTVPCDGVIVHLFCNSCIKQRAEVQVGLMQYELKCFDTSGCQAGFNRSLIRKVIGDKLMKRLEDLQQQDEIAKASIDGLEECPFCEFKAICPPVEENKEFTCLNSDCEKVSCRLCKEETHIPQTCEEARKERGLGERHAVEEAMTAALIRKCPQCGLAIVKEDGCNKLTCRCGTLICDVCKKDISKDGYSHFKVGKCALHEGDTGVRRRTYEVMQAEKAAVAKAVQDGKIDPETLRVTTDSEVNTNQQVPAQHRMPINRPRPVVPQAQMPRLLQMPQIIQYQGPQVPPTGRINRMPQVPQVPQVLQIPRARLVPQVATPTILQAAPILGFNPRARLAQMPDLLRIPDLPMMTMRAVPQTQARQAPPAIPSVQHPQSLLITQPRNTTTTTVAATPIPVQLRRHQSYGQAPQPQVIPPPPPMLQRTNSTPTLQARQQQLNHQYQHSMRRRSGNHPTNP